MTYADIKPRILAALRHGELSTAEIAVEIDEAQFAVRAYAHQLRRERLLEYGSFEGLWKLTDKGARAVNNADQLRLA